MIGWTPSLEPWRKELTKIFDDRRAAREKAEAVWEEQEKLRREKLSTLAGQEPVILSKGSIEVLPRMRHTVKAMPGARCK